MGRRRKEKTISDLTKNYQQKLKVKTGDEFTLTSVFNDKSVSLMHKECKRVFELNPRYFLSKLSCPLCEKDNRYHVRLEKTKKVVSEFKEYLKETVGDEYSVIQDYMDPDDRKVFIRHNKCSHEYYIMPRNFIGGRRCPECTKTQPKPPEEYLREFNDVVKGRFDLITPYEVAIKKVDVLCNKCKKTSKVNPSAFLRDSRCPKCEKKQKHK